MATTLRESGKVISPSWLREHGGERFLWSVNLQLDAVWDWFRQGIRAKMPGYGPEDALPAIGNDVQIFRGPNEPAATYIGRLQKARPTWKKAGGAPAVLEQVASYFAPDLVTVRYIVNGTDENGDQVADWTTRNADGTFDFLRANPSNWDWDGDTTQRRFWIIVYLPSTVVHPKFWGDGHTWGDGTSWGYVESLSIAADLRNLVGKWKAAGTHAWRDGGIILCESPAPNRFLPNNAPGGGTMPDGTWGDPANRVADVFYLSGI